MALTLPGVLKKMKQGARLDFTRCPILWKNVGYGKIGSDLRFSFRLSPQPAEPCLHHRETNLSRMLQVRGEVRLFVGKDVHAARFGGSRCPACERLN
jgi:hypothetical protein